MQTQQKRASPRSLCHNRTKVNTVPRTIIHLDLDAFFCSVEERKDPTLRGRAFAVGGPADGRGVIASCSYAARRFGVRSAMPTGRALTLCPHLLLVKSDFAAYREASHDVMARLAAVTPLIQKLSIDEAFLDITALSVDAYPLAKRLQDEIACDLRLSCSLGIASNKLVAKIATDYGKSAVGTDQSPQAICEVPPGTEAAFLAPLPASSLWGVGPKTAEKLAAMGIRTIGDIANWPDHDLRRRFGEHGRDLARHARGIDDRPVVTERAAKSISRETTFAQNITSVDHLRRTLADQAQHISRDLHKQGLHGATVKLKMRWPDFTTVTRQATRPTATDSEDTICAIAQRLFDQLWLPGKPVRLLGLGVGGLETPLQLDLWDTRPGDEAAKEKRLREAVAAIEAKFGVGIVRRGSELYTTAP